MADIFLSYAREDQERVENLAKALVDQGWLVFWDRTVPAGHTWDSFIGRELDDAECVVVVWSGASVESEWVREEAREGKERNAIVPVFFENVRPPFGFRGIQAADLSTWDGSSTSPLFMQLVADIANKIGFPVHKTELERQSQRPEEERKAKTLSQAVEPESNGQPVEKHPLEPLHLDKTELRDQISPVQKSSEHRKRRELSRRNWWLALWVTIGLIVGFSLLAIQMSKETRSPVFDIEARDSAGASQSETTSAPSDDVVRFQDQNVDEERRASHILVKVDESDPSALADAEKKIAALKSQLAQGKDFAQLAQSTSDDPGSSGNGGDLGFFPRGLMVAPFEEAAFSMRIGEVRGPVQTSYGLHLIKLTGIRHQEKKAINAKINTNNSNEPKSTQDDPCKTPDPPIECLFRQTQESN